MVHYRALFTALLDGGAAEQKSDEPVSRRTT
jgi:hypothetical protein